MSDCCHKTRLLGSAAHMVLHICNRRVNHDPPCVFDLFEKDEPHEPDYLTLRNSREFKDVIILPITLVVR